jgi:hypothetical protein
MDLWYLNGFGKLLCVMRKNVIQDLIMVNENQVSLVTQSLYSEILLSSNSFDLNRFVIIFNYSISRLKKCHPFGA